MPIFLNAKKTEELMIKSNVFSRIKFMVNWTRIENNGKNVYYSNC